VSVVIVGVIRRKPVLTHASIVCEGMLASVNSVKKRSAAGHQHTLKLQNKCQQHDNHVQRQKVCM